MKYILPGLIGALIAVMVLFNGALASVTGTLASSIYIHLGGLITVILVMIFTKQRIPKLRGLPLWLFTGGAIGVATVLLNIVSFNALGVSLTLALGLLGQSISALIVDHYGFLGISKKPFQLKKLMPLLLIVAGISLMAQA